MPKSQESPSFVDPLKEILADSLEVIADSRLEDGILKDLPITGSLLKVYKIFTGVKDGIFFKKLNRFLNELDAISTEKRAEFWSNYEGSVEDKQKLGEQLIIYLDRHDTIDKATLLARAFGAYINGQILKVDFLDLAVLIDSVRVHHLEEITSILILAGGEYSHSSFHEIGIANEWKPFIPELEIQRLLLYEDETKAVEDRYEGSSIKTTRKHKTTSLAYYFLKFVITEFSIEIQGKIDAFHAEVRQAKTALYQHLERERNEESRQSTI